VKDAEITDAVRRFRKAIHAYEELERDLEQARRSIAEAAARFPALARAHRLFTQAGRSLEVIGAAVADVPGLVEELEEGQERLARLKTLAERHGIAVRYDFL
jgi:exonuclease VII small subunit